MPDCRLSFTKPCDSVGIMRSEYQGFMREALLCEASNLTAPKALQTPPPDTTQTEAVLTHTRIAHQTGLADVSVTRIFACFPVHNAQEKSRTRFSLRFSSFIEKLSISLWLSATPLGLQTLDTWLP